MGIRITTTPAYNPKSNPGEQSHRNLGEMMRATMLDDQEGREGLLPQMLFALRTTPNQVMGKSPFETLFRRHPSVPLEVLAEGPPGEHRGQETYHQYANRLQHRI